MGYYKHILICWENGTIIGYAESETVKSIANKWFVEYKNYDNELDMLYKLKGELRFKEKNLNYKDDKRKRELDDKTFTQASLNILESISNGKSFFEGTKGGLWMAGGIFNYTSVDQVLEELLPFFKELKENNCLGSNVIGFNETEQRKNVDVYMIDSNKMEVEHVGTQTWYWGLLS